MIQLSLKLGQSSPHKTLTSIARSAHLTLSLKNGLSAVSSPGTRKRLGPPTGSRQTPQVEKGLFRAPSMRILTFDRVVHREDGNTSVVVWMGRNRGKRAGNSPGGTSGFRHHHRPTTEYLAWGWLRETVGRWNTTRGTGITPGSTIPGMV